MTNILSSLVGDNRPPYVIAVSGAGVAEANGTYTLRGCANGKPFYNRHDANTDELANSIFWFEDNWHITNATQGDYYYAEEDEVNPVDVAEWLVTNSGSASPAPEVEYVL